MANLRTLSLVAVTACSSPSGLTSQAVAALDTTGAAWRSQVIYLVMPDRFRNGDPTNDSAAPPNCFDPNDPQKYHGGDLAGIDQNLAYVQSVGATAIWTTPLYRQINQLASGNCGYHGYWADFAVPDDGAVEPALGSAASLSKLVSDIHSAGMRYILDMVVNHSGDTAQVASQQPSWFHDPATCARLGNPLIYCPLDGHPDFAQEQPAVASYESAIAAGWTKFGIDGIRMDTTKYVLPSYFQNSFFPAVRAVNPNLWSVAEIFDTGPTSPFVPYLDAGFDSAFHFELYAALQSGVGAGGSIDAVASAIADGIATLGMDGALDLVLLIDNHDTPRFANTPGYGVPEDEIRRRLLLALDLIFTLPGIPQLYYGDEIGMYGGADPDNRRDFPAWATDATQRSQPHPGEAVAGSDIVFARAQKLAQLRTSTQALIDGAYRELWRQNGGNNPNVFAFARGTGTDARLVVISNGSDPSGTIHIPVPADVVAANTTLVDVLGDGAPATTTLVGGDLVVDLPGRSAAIYMPQ